MDTARRPSMSAANTSPDVRRAAGLLASAQYYDYQSNHPGEQMHNQHYDQPHMHHNYPQHHSHHTMRSPTSASSANFRHSQLPYPHPMTSNNSNYNIHMLASTSADPTNASHHEMDQHPLFSPSMPQYEQLSNSYSGPPLHQHLPHHQQSHSHSYHNGPPLSAHSLYSPHSTDQPLPSTSAPPSAVVKPAPSSEQGDADGIETMDDQDELTNNAPRSPKSGPKRKPTRRYNASCDTCRARKRKCPGRDPETQETLCTACADRGIPCTYGNMTAPRRKADVEAEKLASAREQLVDAMKEALRADDLSAKDEILAAALGPRAAAILAAKPSKAAEPANSAMLNSDSVLQKKQDPPRYTNSIDSKLNNAGIVEPHQLQKTGSSDTVNGVLHAESNADGSYAAPSPRPSSDDETAAQFTQALISAASDRSPEGSEIERQMTLYMHFALPHGEAQGGPLPHEDQRLLDFYFAWLNPRYALIHKKLFYESRASGDEQFCSSFLLWSLFAHSSSHCPGFEDRRAYYRARAHLLLAKELSKAKAASVTTAQGLILLAGTAAARSDHSLAWTLTFTCTAMVIDLLENIDDSISQTEIKLRKRLYWSHYVWSIVISLNLNRKPSVPKLKVEYPEPMDEIETWEAALPVRNDMSGVPLDTITIPRPGHEIECFRQISQLFTFLDEILTSVYVAAHEKKPPQTINATVQGISERMLRWQSREIPNSILLKTDSLPELCPPPHIVHFNLLLRSTWILLYRPFYNMGRNRNPISGAREACNQCASEIYAIFRFFERDFGVLQLHFSYIYAAYWAATIDVAAAKREGLNPDLLSRLRNSSRILLTWVSLPGMKQSTSELISQIEALLLADVPPAPAANGAFAAYDPLHSRTYSAGPSAQPFSGVFNPMQEMLRPDQQGLMLTDPAMNIPSPADYASIGELYWQPSWELW